MATLISSICMDTLNLIIGWRPKHISIKVDSRLIQCVQFSKWQGESPLSGKFIITVMNLANLYCSYEITI